MIHEQRNGDAMNTDRIEGIAKGTVGGAKRIANHQLAESGRDSGNIAAVFEAYEKTVEDRAKAEEALTEVLKIKLGTSNHIESQEPIRAIRDVALAAIDLARSVARKFVEDQP
ncbi:MAG: hypothetical protein ACKVP2_01670 [Burkholderiales bacterium]